jgi:hypothetical protein
MSPRKVYTQDDYAPFIGKGGMTNAGLLALPNQTDVDPLTFLQDLAARGHMMEPVWGYALLPDGSGQQWTQFFLLADANMAMQLGGGGYAVTYGKSSWDDVAKKSVQHPIVRRFQICQHEIELSAGANPDRGWRPGACKHCGMDMTVDSGD